MTRPRSQSQAARLQPRVLFTVLLQGSLWKRNSKLSFKIPEMDLLRQPSSALLLKKRREKKKKEWFKPLWTIRVPTYSSAQHLECHLWTFHGCLEVGS